MLKFLIPLIIIASPAIAVERVTFGKCMAAAAIAGHHNYHWKELSFTREDCADLAESMKGRHGRELAVALAPEVHIHIHVAHDRQTLPHHWEELDLSQAAPGYWSNYSNGQSFFHQFHQNSDSGRHDY